MECKIDHTADGAIPASICRVCNPPLMGEGWFPQEKRAPVVSDMSPEATVRYDRKVKRRLRAEVKAWRERVEAIERYTMTGPALAKARETLRKAETDLYMVA